MTFTAEDIRNSLSLMLVISPVLLVSLAQSRQSFCRPFYIPARVTEHGVLPLGRDTLLELVFEYQFVRFCMSH